MITKPMLSGNAPKKLSQLSYPTHATPKLDGIRAVMVEGNLVSRTFKPIKNNFIRELVESVAPNGFDGELMSGDTFQETTSAVMTVDGQPNFSYHVFDYVKDSLDKPYVERMKDLMQWYIDNGAPLFIKPVLPRLLDNEMELLMYENEVLSKGYEGVMVRLENGPYKCGRSTTKEGYLLKIKRFQDSEAEIIGFEELYHNMNEAKKDNFGRTERSSHKENKVPAGVLGKFVVKDLETGITFGVGTGFDASQRESFWINRESLVGKIVKYKSFSIGVKEAPRHPVFLSFRDPDDM